ncbi:MAG: acetyl-CoA hydrolase/transferase C-terminal domain-containing protein [Gammaproteobacteria bacterium]|nr:acetyl-CoA hydrolase/transferase C-terminal domain-containing protein [Gammaproteobacteria bacterium]
MFYDFLNDLDDSERARFHMHGVERINQLYGDDVGHRVAQRRRARFVNTCMMMTATGAAVSDGLADYQVVSGVGGQYNFVAMAHALEDGRSVLMLRATREKGDDTTSNIVWQYAHNTIPRHLRDLVVTEYGVADLRGKTDEECIQALIAITDARFQEGLAEEARAAGKLDSEWEIPAEARENTPATLKAALQPFIDAGHFLDYPFGSDLTDVEQRLVPALNRLQGASKWQLARMAWSGRPAEEADGLARLGLEQPRTLNERFHARLVAGALAV